MTELNVHIGKNGKGFKIAYFTGNPKPLDKVIESIPRVESFYNLGEFLKGKGVRDVNFIPAIPDPKATLEDVANELVNAEGQQVDIYVGTFNSVNEQIELFGLNHGLGELPDDDLADIYRQVKKALAS